MNTRRRSQMLQWASVGAPVLLIVTMRSIVLSGPSGASAATGGHEVIAAVPPPPPGTTAGVGSSKPITPEQQRVVDWRSSLKLEASLTSPMDTRIDVVLLPPKKAETPVVPEAPKVDLLEGLVLSGFMGNQTRGLVTISGKVYRVGDVVKPGLRLTAIDLRGGSVSLTSDAGDVLVLVKPE
jgi:hypothetical protein